MITLAINALSSILLKTEPMKISSKSVEELKCRIVEVSETQDYGLPNFPVDDNTYKNDTIYKNPKRLMVRVYVKADDIEGFLANVEKVQFSEELFNIHTLYNITYENFKIVSYSRDLNSTMLQATHYNLAMQEVVMVKALVESYKSGKKAGYGSKKEQGNKQAQETKKSTLLEGSNKLGFLK